METKVVNCRFETYDVYIGRPSVFGNPFSHQENTKASVKVQSREAAIDMYRKWVNGEVTVNGLNPLSMNEIKSLRGKVLGCWCKPHSCHGDILAEICDSDNDIDIDDYSTV